LPPAGGAFGLRDQEQDQEQDHAAAASSKTDQQTRAVDDGERVETIADWSEEAAASAAARRLGGEWDGVGGTSVSAIDIGRIQRVTPLLQKLARERGVEPGELFASAVERFKADSDVQRKRLSLAVFCSQLEQWVDGAPGAHPQHLRPLPPVET
jgi:hypothetical protein